MVASLLTAPQAPQLKHCHSQQKPQPLFLFCPPSPLPKEVRQSECHFSSLIVQTHHVKQREAHEVHEYKAFRLLPPLACFYTFKGATSPGNTLLHKLHLLSSIFSVGVIWFESKLPLQNTTLYQEINYYFSLPYFHDLQSFR